MRCHAVALNGIEWSHERSELEDVAYPLGAELVLEGDVLVVYTSVD